jgi:PAS domain S-box-containing protein
MAKKHQSMTNDMLRGLFDNRAIGTAVFDLSGNLIEVNNRLIEVLGYNLEELVAGLDWMDLLPPDWRSRDAEAWKKAAAKSFFRNHEIEFVKKNGKPAWLLISGGILIKEDDGNHVLFIMVVDISGQRKHIDTLEKANEQLSDRSDALDKQLKNRQNELAGARKEAKQHQKNLKKLNDAMNVLMSDFQDEKKDLEERIVQNFQLTVVPLIDHLKTQNLPESQLHLLNTLDFAIKNITSYFGINVARNQNRLSLRETQICQMILQGLDSREIAQSMGLSYQTVIVHRKNIRKKLGIKKSKQNLATFLRQTM